MKLSRLSLLAALMVSVAVVQPTFAADKFESAYFKVMQVVRDSWVGNGPAAVFTQAPGIEMTGDAEVRTAVRTTLSGLNDQRFRILTQADLDKIEMQAKAGTVNLGAEIKSVEVVGPGGIEVSTVSDNTFAKATGLAVHDKILLLNGHPVIGMRGADVEAMWKEASSGPLSLVVYRNTNDNDGVLLRFSVQRANDGSTGVKFRVLDTASVPKVISVNPDGPAFAAGLRPGDVVDLIDGMSTRTLPISTVQSYVASGGPFGSSFTLGVTRLGRPLELTVQRRIIEGSTPVIAITKREADNAAQATNPVFADWVLSVKNLDWNTKRVLAVLDQAIADNAHLPGAVIDLRNVQGSDADTAAQIGARFITKGNVLMLVKGSGDHQVTVKYAVNEGVLTRTTSGTGTETQTETLASNLHPFAGQVAVVVDSRSSRVGAALAQGLQSSGRAKILGKRTSDDALLLGVVSTNLTDGSALSIEMPVARLLRTDGSNMSAVMPDLEADLSSQPFDAFKTIEAANKPAAPPKS